MERTIINTSLWCESDGGVEGVERAIGALHGVLHDGHVAHQHRAARVDGEGAAVVHWKGREYVTKYKL